MKAKGAISSGDEILVNYNLDLSMAPEWYKALWVRHLRTERCMTDEDIERWRDKESRVRGRFIDLSEHLRQQG